ncbi:ATP-binding cassette domain-containing protein [Virgibacillus proomii]|jgi:ABC-2 type transport system ATP-binding protein|uniref:ATP-binding cassette domain-containing protein n=1 Tax=Virgibacillus proomii TaxID=84407 RepID=UPI000987055E|nr:ABC transporter ATP-binding protein [Virgibacillus proomii]
MVNILIDNLCKVINENEVIRKADAHISGGEICAFIGPNGVGKTTLLKCLLGLLSPDQGSIKIDNQVLSKSNRSEMLKEFGSVIQLPPSTSDMTVYELFVEHYNYMEIKEPTPHMEMLELLELQVPLTKKIGQLSLGMKQRLQLAIALSHRPKIIILDEPFNGLDFDGINLMKEILSDLKGKGACVIITSHSLSELENFVTSVVFMLNGKTYKKRELKDIVKNYSGGLKEYYYFLKRGGITN